MTAVSDDNPGGQVSKPSAKHSDIPSCDQEKVPLIQSTEQPYRGQRGKLRSVDAIFKGCGGSDWAAAVQLNEGNSGCWLK